MALGACSLGDQIKDLYTSMSATFFVTKRNGSNSPKKSKKSKLRRNTYEMDNKTKNHKFSQ